jgi:UDP-N-acetylglucosamine/UDP-N-acetylgalactosamine diphosphorylase
MKPTRDELYQRLAARGQAHILRFWDQLDASGRQQLAEQVAAVDLAWLERVYRTSDQHRSQQIVPYDAVIRPGGAEDQEALRVGEEALRRGSVGTLLVAGGSGTRLGFEGPKGAFPLGAVSGRTLFQIHVERLLALGVRYGTVPPLYLMTSPDNHQQTCALFAERRNFGLPAERLLIFPQGVAPAVDEAGKLLLASKSSLVLAANGNGGLFAALRDGGAFDHMRRCGISTISYIQVDNPLSLSCDPLFVGYHLLRESEFSCKAIPKVGPFERVGNYAQVDGRLGIVEYTEIPQELAAQRDERGELLFNYGNPGLFNWSRTFAEAQAARSDLPFHRAHKKVQHLDHAGNLVEPDAPNGYKFESFALDTLLVVERALLLACDRDAEFAPVKNAEGQDSPTSARALMTKLYRGWIERAGAVVEGNGAIEISARYALDADELASRLPAGYRTAGDVYLA